MIDVPDADVASLSADDAVSVTVTDELGRVDVARYAGASGDFNPLHVDEVYAREAGHDSVIAHGMFVCGYAAQVITGWLEGDCIERLDVRFVSPAMPGDAVVVDCEVTDGENGDEGAKRVAVTVVDGDGASFAEGTASVDSG